MKTLHWFSKLVGFTSLAGALALANTALAGDPTAYDLVKEGNKNVGAQSKDKVVQIRSEKSVGSVNPNIWYVVYYDEFATMKATEVKFAAGKVVSVKRPMRVIEAASDNDAPMNAKQMKVDSDKALKIALKESILENLTIKASLLKLENYNAAPTWKITLWAAKLKNPKNDAEIGQIFVAAEDGKVVKLDIKPSKVE